MTAITVRRNLNRPLTVMEPFYPTSFLEDLERWVGDTWETYTPVDHIHPRLDMYEGKDEMVVKAELPGITKEDIDISLEGDSLNIKAEKKQESLAEDTTYYSCERYYGQYFRTVTLPYPVDSEKVSSTFENGLLEIRLPKAEEAKAKHIEVKVK
ncbi:MAG: Hsp20/alpha crystallin family protein [Chloroflexi bacterium]|nr:Hsp20/alpha crystallin family protein [Chloroflexota bacterium]MBI2979679.1 Hsp20/alpha crystallin family protein [Chloroflexota bacterium]